jgi:hypothetical protein
MRMQIRRLTRLTNAFPEKWGNLEAAVALHFAFYNLCRGHARSATTLMDVRACAAEQRTCIGSITRRNLLKELLAITGQHTLDRKPDVAQRSSDVNPSLARRRQSGVATRFGPIRAMTRGRAGSAIWSN